MSHLFKIVLMFCEFYLVLLKFLLIFALALK